MKGKKMYLKRYDYGHGYTFSIITMARAVSSHFLTGFFNPNTDQVEENSERS